MILSWQVQHFVDVLRRGRRSIFVPRLQRRRVIYNTSLRRYCIYRGRRATGCLRQRQYRVIYNTSLRRHCIYRGRRNTGCLCLPASSCDLQHIFASTLHLSWQAQNCHQTCSLFSRKNATETMSFVVFRDPEFLKFCVSRQRNAHLSIFMMLTEYVFLACRLRQIVILHSMWTSVTIIF